MTFHWLNLEGLSRQLGDVFLLRFFLLLLLVRFYVDRRERITDHDKLPRRRRRPSYVGRLWRFFR